MLILSRKPGESIVIDGRITIKVIRLEGDMVKIGIEAPREVPVHRQEVYDEIQMSNREALTEDGLKVPRFSTGPQTGQARDQPDPSAPGRFRHHPNLRPITSPAMQVSPLSASAVQTAELKSKELATGAPASGASDANSGPSSPARLSPADPTTTSSPLPTFDDAELTDAGAAGKSLNFASSSILGNSTAALQAQANLNPETVLQLLAD